MLFRYMSSLSNTQQVHTKCLSFKSCTILDVHSPGGKMSAFNLNSFRTHNAVHCLTLSVVSGDTNNLGTSWPTASTISWLPMFAMHCRARQTLMGLRLDRSFLMLWMISLISSLLALTSTEMNRYPCNEMQPGNSAIFRTWKCDWWVTNASEN